MDGQIYNVNADQAACGIAIAMHAKSLSFVSNVPGVLQNGTPLPMVTPIKIDELIAIGEIKKGMVPKVQSALDASKNGIQRVRIVNLKQLSQEGGTHILDEIPEQTHTMKSSTLGGNS
jgi:acetylglutamate kinase